MKIKLIAGIVCLSVWLTANAQATEVEWWHPFGGKNGEIVQELVDNFNAEHPGIVVKSIKKGGYADCLNGGIAAYRAGHAPELLVVLGRDAPTLMTSGAVQPVHKLMPRHGFDVDWDQFIGPAMAMFSDAEGPVSMPFNSSTPILWYNLDAFKKAGVSEPPQTWFELEEVSKKILAAGYECAITAGWPNWVHLDAYSQIHRIPVATNNNGMDGWDTEFLFHKQPMYVNHVKRLKRWVDEGLYTYSGRTGSAASAAFRSGKCAMLLDSSAGYAGTKAAAKFQFSAAYMLHEAGWESPANSLIGGGSIFVMKGNSEAVDKAAAEFLNWIQQVPQQIFWHKRSGYVPLSLKAYEVVKAEGYYDETPHQELAILQLNRGGKPGLYNRGFRFGYASQVYNVMNEDLERVFAGEKDVETALADASRRANEIVARFARTIEQ